MTTSAWMRESGPWRKPQGLLRRLLFSLVRTKWLVYWVESESRLVLCDSSRPHGLYSPWSSPGQNTAAGSLSLLQVIFPTPGLNPGLQHCRWILYQLSHKEGPYQVGILVNPVLAHTNVWAAVKGLGLTSQDHGTCGERRPIDGRPRMHREDVRGQLGPLFSASFSFSLKKPQNMKIWKIKGKKKHTLRFVVSSVLRLHYIYQNRTN